MLLGGNCVTSVIPADLMLLKSSVHDHFFAMDNASSQWAFLFASLMDNGLDRLIMFTLFMVSVDGLIVALLAGFQRPGEAQRLFFNDLATGAPKPLADLELDERSLEFLHQGGHVCQEFYNMLLNSEDRVRDLARVSFAPLVMMLKMKL